MHEYTHNQHIKYGYSNPWFDQRLRPSDKLQVIVGRCSRPARSFRDECLHTAKLVKQKADGLSMPVDILFSGGNDSEVIVRSFLDQNISVRINVIRFAYDLNKGDFNDAISVCKRYGVIPVIHDLDIIDFLENDSGEYAESAQTFHASYLAPIWLMDKLDGFTVMGGRVGDIVNEHYKDSVFTDTTGRTRVKNNRKKTAGKKWMYHLNEQRHLAWMRYLVNKQKPGVIDFFGYTPEILCAYLDDPILKSFFIDPGLAIKETCKFSIMDKHFPDLQQKKKLHGYEHIDVARMEAVIRDRLYRKYGIFNNHVEIELDSIRYNDK